MTLILFLVRVIKADILNSNFCENRSVLEIKKEVYSFYYTPLNIIISCKIIIYFTQANKQAAFISTLPLLTVYAKAFLMISVAS